MEEHGEFKLGPYNNILCAKLHGSWNEETAFRFSKELGAAEILQITFSNITSLNNHSIAAI